MGESKRKQRLFAAVSLRDGERQIHWTSINVEKPSIYRLVTLMREITLERDGIAGIGMLSKIKVYVATDGGLRIWAWVNRRIEEFTVPASNWSLSDGCTSLQGGC